MARPKFVSLVNPLATHMLGESASVEIQASLEFLCKRHDVRSCSQIAGVARFCFRPSLHDRAHLLRTFDRAFVFALEDRQFSIRGDRSLGSTLRLLLPRIDQ